MFHTGRHVLLVVLAIAVANVAGLFAEVNAEPPRYNWEAGQKFSYRFDITVDGDDAKTTYKGVTNYTVDAASPEQIRVTYRGGLTESKTTKRSSQGPRGFGGPFGRPSVGGPFGARRGIPNPFSRPVFAGRTQTTNRITMTPRGSLLAMEGDSQLPYLLGNVSLLPFEEFPEGAESEWSVDAGVSVTKEDGSRGRRFGPFGPFAGQNKQTLQTADEVTGYSIQDASGDLVTITRTYNLTMPQIGDNPAFEMTGTGTWTFDQKENVPHALDVNYKLTVTQGATTTTIPISVKYTRISAEELAQLEAATKREADQRAQAAADAKAKAETPLTSDEKREVVGALASSDHERITKTLALLAAKALEDPDPEVAAAIENLLDSENKGIAAAAHVAMLKWSPTYQLKKGLAKAYQGPAVLKSTGLVVESGTPLYVGQLVQSQRKNRGSFWFAAQVQELLSDGTVKMGFLTWGNVRDSEIVPRRGIQLAPEELEQPVKPPSPAVVSSQLHTWSDATGHFKLEAEFVSVADGKVSLRRADNRVIAVPLDKLSAADQAYAQQLQQAENPFDVD